MKNPSTEELKTLQLFAERTAIEAGKILLRYKAKAKVVTRKTDFHDVATEADIASEKFILGEISRHYPGHSVLAEESGQSSQSSQYTWIIDPLDGTKEYVRGLNTYNVSIALEYRGGIVAGTVYKPETRETYFAGRGLGVRYNGRKVHCSQVSSLKDSHVYTHLPKYNDTESDRKKSLSMLEMVVSHAHRVRTLADDVISLAYIAQGASEGFYLISTFPKWWDVAAGILMVEEAGGKVTDMYGKPIKNRDLSKGIVASNGKIHEELLKIINGVLV